MRLTASIAERPTCSDRAGRRLARVELVGQLASVMLVLRRSRVPCLALTAWLIVLIIGPALGVRHACHALRSSAPAGATAGQRPSHVSHHHARTRQPTAPGHANQPCRCLDGCCCAAGPQLRASPSASVVVLQRVARTSAAVGTTTDHSAARERVVFPTGPPVTPLT
jgi:hypothetical protein